MRKSATTGTEHPAELSEVMDDVVLEHMGKNGMQDDPIDTR